MTITTTYAALHDIDRRVQERIERGFNDYSAVSHALAERPTTKAQAAEWATITYGVEVRASWTIRQIIEACGVAIAAEAGGPNAVGQDGAPLTSAASDGHLVNVAHDETMDAATRQRARDILARRRAGGDHCGHDACHQRRTCVYA